MKNLMKIEQKTNEKFLNLFEATYMDDCSTTKYTLASRREQKDLTVFNANDKIDAVKALPYFYEDGNLFVVFIKEFRRALNKYIYAVPAGLVGAAEEPEIAIQRELREEIGAQTLELAAVDGGCYSTPGMTDEKVMHFFAEVSLSGIQKLEPDEDISLEIVPFEEILQFTGQHEFSLSGLLLAKMFYYKTKAEG